MRHPCPDLRGGSAGSYRFTRCPPKRLFDLPDGADRRDDMIVHGHTEGTKLLGKLSMFVCGEAPFFTNFDVLQTAVHRGGFAIE